MSKIEIFCVTNIPQKKLEALNVTLVGVGKNIFPKKYITCLKGKKIQHKEKNYSELTFHYWFWKNKLKNYNKNKWIGFCQKRRFWLIKKKKITSYNLLKKFILKKPKNSWNKFDSILCKPISVKGHKKMKLIKRGWKNILGDPSVLVNKGKHNIKLHFDMHHGYGVLDKAINVLSSKDRNGFRKYVETNTKFNPNIMYISKKKILDRWFKDLFKWLFRCEKVFGTKQLKGYDQERLYAYLAERYLPFWFKKYTRSTVCDWGYYDFNVEKSKKIFKN